LKELSIKLANRVPTREAVGPGVQGPRY